MKKILLIIIIIGLLALPIPTYAQSVYYPMHVNVKEDGGAELFSVTENQIQFAWNNTDNTEAILDTDIYDKSELSGGVIDLKITMQGSSSWFELDTNILRLEWQRNEYSYSTGGSTYVARLDILFSEAFKVGDQLTLWRIVGITIAVYNASMQSYEEIYKIVDKTLITEFIDNTVSINVVFGIFRRDEDTIEVMWSIEGKDPQGYTFKAPKDYDEVQYSYFVLIPADSQNSRVITINSMKKFYSGLYTSERIHKAVGGNAWLGPLAWIFDTIGVVVKDFTGTIIAGVNAGVYWFYSTFIEPSFNFFYSLMPDWLKAAIDMFINIIMMLLNFLPLLGSFGGLLWSLWVISGLAKGDLDPLISTWDFIIRVGELIVAIFELIYGIIIGIISAIKNAIGIGIAAA